ncbi:MAG TPA: DUF2227 family putative metal-binding protein [Anaerolineaceae bacterium]
MPSGRIHSTATVMLAAAGAYFSLRGGSSAAQTVALSAGVLTGLVLTPDLDVDDGCTSTLIIRRVFGRAAAQLWTIFWLPYSLSIPHRSRLSHLPILSTVIRLAYVLFIPLLIYFLAGLPFRLPPLPVELAWAAAGLALADILHFVMDSVF